MKKVMKYPIYPITFSYVSGIFCSHYFRLPFLVPLTLVTLAFVVLIYLYFSQRNIGFKNLPNSITWVVVCVLFLSMGACMHHVANQKVKVDDLNQTQFTIQIDEVLKSNQYAHRAYATLLSEIEKPQVVISYPKESCLPRVGEIYKMVGTINEVAAPRNLYDFNYKQYLQHKQIYYQINSYHAPVKIGEEQSFNSLVVSLRDYLVSQFSHLGYDAKTQGFAEALLFGIKTNLRDELQQQFQDFGILHVLAVSGMHVVLLFSTISYVLTHLRVPKKVIPVILVVFLLVFSLMAGFSGSVVRAALMCVMGMIGVWSKRNVDTLNLMMGSMLLILIVAPNYLFDVGFQLSYLAVFAIVYCYPVIQRYFTFRNWIGNYFGQLIGVSLVAQLGVLPLSILYFKQIPLLFLIGNLIAIPITSFLLVAWFIQMVLSLIVNDLAAFFTPILHYVSSFCFDTLSNLSDYFSVKTIDFYLTPIQTIILLLLIFSAFWFFKTRKVNQLFVSLICIVAFQSVSIIEHTKNQSKRELVMLSDNNKIVILNRSGSFLHQIGGGNMFTDRTIKNYQLHNQMKVHHLDSLAKAFTLNNKEWLLVDSLSIYPKKPIDYVVLYQNPKLNLDRLISDTQPKLVILHRSNYQYLTDEYIAYFDQKKIPYYDMRTKGSFVLSYNSDNN